MKMLWAVFFLLPLLLFVLMGVMGQDKIWTRIAGLPPNANDVGFGVAVDTNSASVGWGVAVDSISGAVYVTGRVNGIQMGPNVGGFDIVLLKYASNGTRLWTRISGTTGADLGCGVALDAGSGAVYVTGQVSGSLNGEAFTEGNGIDIVLLKYTSSGTVVWTRIVGTNGTDVGYAVAVDSSTGDVYVAGQAHGDLNGEGNNMDVPTAKTTWASLSRAIDEIYNQNNSNLSFEESYRYGYNLVMQKHGDLLYEGLKITLTKHLQVTFQIIAAAHSEQLLETLAAEWSRHTTAFDLIKDILMYVDKSYCSTKKKPLVKDLAYSLFRDVALLAHDATMPRIRAELLQQIALERGGCIIDRGVMLVVIRMLLSLSTATQQATVYEEAFEPFFLADTQVFYQREALQFLSSSACADYIRKAEARLREEAERLANYLPSSLTETKLRSVLESELIARHAQALLDMPGSGLAAMLSDSRADDLKLTYNLFARVPTCLDLLREQVGRLATAAGAALLASPDATKEPVVFVKRVLELKLKYDIIIRDCWRGDKKFSKQLREAFEVFLNKDNKCASYLANYVDELLRTSGQAESELEASLDQAVVLFKFLQDKDVFEAYYRKLLSKRLLNSKSSSEEGEKSMLSRLKAECGYQFTSKLEGMLLDMSISKGIMEGYRAHWALEVEVLLLTTGYWLLTPSPSPSCRLPLAITQSMAHFRAYYLEKNSGRKLAWFSNAGSVDMKASFSQGRKELSVSVYQMCILLLFNENSTLTLEEIATQTEIPDLELRQHLLSLCTPKIKILSKASKGRGIEANDSFSVNADF
eukprot:gene28471-34368_t